MTKTLRPSSDAVLHMSRMGEQRIFLICIRFGSCEVRRLNLALEFRVYYYFALFTNRERAWRYAQQYTWTFGRMREDYKGTTVEPLFNKVAGDRPNLFVKWRVRYIENLDITNLRGNDQNVRYIEVIVND